MEKAALSPFKGAGLGRGGDSQDSPYAWEHMGYFLNRTCNFFLASKTVCTMSEAGPANPYQNQTQIN